MRRWGVVLRIASRDARHSLGRTLTAVILISLPIVVAIGSLTFWDVTTSQRYQASSWLGHTSDVQAVTLRRSSTALDQDFTADRLSKTASDEEVDVTMQTLADWVPPGDQLVAVDTLYQLHLTAPGGTGYTVDSGIETASLDAPRVQAGHRHGVLETNHAVISDDVARALGVTTGDTVALSLTVAKDRTTQALEGNAVIDAVIAGSGCAIIGDGTLDIDRLAVAGRTQTAWYVTGPVPVTWDDVRTLNKSGFSVVSRQVLASPPDASALPALIAQYEVPQSSRSSSPWQYLLGIAGVLLIVTEMILLISPLYTVAQRSVMRTAAMIVANGGDRSDGRRLTVAHGIVIGIYSAAFSVMLSAGLMVGIGLWSGLGIGILPFWPLALSVTLPILLSLMASVSPAHTSSHIDTSAVIGGRVWEPSRLVRRRMIYPVLLLSGIPLLAVAAWFGSVFTLVLGVALLEVGLIGSIPYVFTRWRVPNRRASMSMRLALRDAVRNGHRTFPAMASILTTVFVACALLITLSSSNEAGWNSRPHVGQRGQIFVSAIDKTDSVTRSRALMKSATDAVGNERTVVSKATLYGIAWNSGPGGPETMVEAIVPADHSTLTQLAAVGQMAELDVAYIVDDGTYLRQAGYFTNEDDMVRAIATLNAGGVLVPDPAWINGAGQAELRSLDMKDIAAAKAAGASDDALPNAQVMASQSFAASPLTRVNVMVLSPAAATTLGLDSVPLGELLTVDNPVNSVDAPTFQATIARQVPGASAQVITPTMRSIVLPYVAALIAIVAAAATVALVVALSASDMRPDLDTLDAIGAAPAMRRHVTTWQGVVLALNAIPTAVLSGLIVGVLAVVTFARSGIFRTLVTLTPVIPWGALVGMLVGMPLLCALVAIVLTPRQQHRIRRIN
ncbi:ABC transporter permease [Actinomyces bouchesdurhonensis]|uniref:ABC transporter permease n=1 Tax=Actinomyces bouchesdurhonensis TaxID=1852361 RepID=UPI0023F306A7|nr:ABC transporter permease [Actinomyces bouchesdurhonensis]